MLASRSNQNYSDKKGGQTLFQFLKRKKKVALQISLCNSRRQNNIKSAVDTYSARKYEKVVRFDDELELQSDIACNTYRTNNKNNYRTNNKQGTNTPFKNIQSSKKAQYNSLIEMISPSRKNSLKNSLKNQTSLTPERSSNKYKESKSIRKRDNDKQNVRMENKQNKKKTQEVFYRKNLNNSISVMKQTLLRYINTGRNIKSKAHTLIVDLKPILKFVQEGKNKNFAQKAQDIRLKLKSFEVLFKQFDADNSNEIIQKFHQNLSEHLLSLEGKIRSQLEKGDIATLTKIREQKDHKISELSDTKLKLEQQLDKAHRKLQKIANKYERLVEQNQANQQSKDIKAYNTNTLYQQKLLQYEKQLQYLTKQLANSKQKQIILQKKLKDTTYLKQQSQHRFILQNTKIRSSKQDYLLNQIQILKKQFKNDMKQINYLYSQKQNDQNILIQQLKLQLKQIKQMLIQQQTNNKLILNENHENNITNIKKQMQKYKIQNQCLILDLNRMNQELYQHWLALNDIKILSTRLQIFSKFMGIYQDLAFNDQLFGR